MTQHLVELTSAEVRTLSSLTNATLLRVRHNPLFAGVELGEAEPVMVAVRPELGASPVGPEEIIGVRLVPLREADLERASVRRFNSVITDVRVLSAVVVFSEPHDAPATEILGVPLSSGIEYSVSLVSPAAAERNGLASELRHKGHYNRVDIGFLFHLADGTTVVLATDGMGHLSLDLLVDPPPDQRRQWDELPCSCRLGDRAKQENAKSTQ